MKATLLDYVSLGDSMEIVYSFVPEKYWSYGLNEKKAYNINHSEWTEITIVDSKQMHEGKSFIEKLNTIFL